MFRTGPDWFQLVAKAVRDIVDDGQGAIVMTRPQLLEEIIRVDATCADCPPRVIQHFTCALKPRQGLEVRGFFKDSPYILVIFDPKRHNFESACAHCCDDLPPEVEIALMEMKEAVSA